MKPAGTATELSPLDAMAEGFEPSPLPPMAPDGGPMLGHPPEPEPRPACPSLCEIGPCRRLHVMVASMDAQSPLGEAHDPTRHRQTIRTCYPHPGVTTDLADAVVFECNLWDPFEPGDQGQLQARRRRVIDQAYRERDASDPPIIVGAAAADPEGEIR